MHRKITVEVDKIENSSFKNIFKEAVWYRNKNMGIENQV